MKTCKSQLCVFSFCHSFQIWRNWLDRTSLRFVTNRKNKERCFFLLQTMHGNSFKEGWKCIALKRKPNKRSNFPLVSLVAAVISLVEASCTSLRLSTSSHQVATRQYSDMKYLFQYSQFLSPIFKRKITNKYSTAKCQYCSQHPQV